MNKLYHLNFLKLMLANHAAGIAAIAARFTSKAWRMGDKLDWQLIDNFIAVDIGDRHFCGGD